MSKSPHNRVDTQIHTEVLIVRSDVPKYRTFPGNYLGGFIISFILLKDFRERIFIGCL